MSARRRRRTERRLLSDQPQVRTSREHSADRLSDKVLTVREAATRLKVGKTALYEALRADEARARVAVAGIHHTPDLSVC